MNQPTEPTNLIHLAMARAPAAIPHRDRLTFPISRIVRSAIGVVFVMGLTTSALSSAAVAGPAQMADADQNTVEQSLPPSCRHLIPALQNAGYSAQIGHLQALRSLELCYIRLGELDRANLVRWRIYEDLNRADPDGE